MKRFQTLKLFLLFLFLGTQNISFAQHSVARDWNEALLHAIRNDYARPTVHARNLFHTSIAMWDAWAIYDDVAQPFLLGKTVRGFSCPFEGVPEPSNIDSARHEAISYACYRLLFQRFIGSPGAVEALTGFNDLFQSYGYNSNYTSTDYTNGNPAALGNYIAEQLLYFGDQDNSNEENDYANKFYEPVNDPLVTNFPGNPNLNDPNRWQPLTLDVFIDQAGNEIPFNTPPFLSPEWGEVTPFALKEDDLTLHTRFGDVYWAYHDPGYPPYLDTTQVGGISEEYKWGFSLVSVWSSHLDPEDGVMWDISPASIGNVSVDQYPTDIAGLRNFYNLYDGGDPGTGYDINPHTGAPYEPQMVPRADYGRVLAEFWADGPDSETPPGHWFTLLNYVNDHPDFEKRFRGFGPIIEDLEWDVKAYFTLAGAMHDAAVTVWGLKGWYDYIRPIGAIRGMAEYGQSTSDTLPSYHPGGIPLIPGYIELVEEGDPLVGDSTHYIGKIKVKAWKGPDFINNPDTDVAGVDWILADNWWPYQRPSFVTPNFAGYVSGHSTFSRAAAEVMTSLTGTAYFPGGMGQFNADQNEFLVFEEGPSTDIILQWATYRDASDQCSLSRIWGGIHPPADDIPGRLMGIKIGNDAFEKAESYFFFDGDGDGYFNFEDCDDNNADINPGATELCNGLDENCNNLIDEDVPVITYYFDADNDGYGNPDMTVDTCASFAPVGYVDNNFDCDDSNENINPDAAESCDNIDNNCNGLVDDGLDLFTYFVDADNDGFGSTSMTIDTCQNFAPDGFSENSSDCDDSNENINPDTDEVCDGIDNNCNNMIDDGLTLNTYYQDADQDGFGNASETIETCADTAPEGYVANDMDCNDFNNTISPDGEEIPNNDIDEDCDGDDLIISTEEVFGTNIEMFPNPVADALILRSAYEGNLYLKIISNDGKLILEENINFNSGSHSVDFSDWAPGVYYIHLSDNTGEQQYTEKIVKQ